MMKTVLITGVTGFVGSALAKCLYKDGYALKCVVRNFQQNSDCKSWDNIIVGDIHGSIDWSGALADVDTVIHLAARVHIMGDDSSESLADFRKVNVDATLNLAQQAASHGIKRFIYLSSIKVNGEGTKLGQVYTPDDIPSPSGAYSVSKYEAENGLLELCQETNLEIVIIRPVLVYGPGAKANFLNMMRWLNKGIPLPFGAIRNRRSLVALDNLVDLIVTCINHPAAVNQIFLVSDDEDLSTTHLLYRMGEALGEPARLVPMPAGILKASATLLGKHDIAQRLLGSLQVDISKTKEMLGWSPLVSVDKALKKTAEHFLTMQQK